MAEPDDVGPVASTTFESLTLVGCGLAGGGLHQALRWRRIDVDLGRCRQRPGRPS